MCSTHFAQHPHETVLVTANVAAAAFPAHASKATGATTANSLRRIIGNTPIIETIAPSGSAGLPELTDSASTLGTKAAALLRQRVVL
jgi:hypothetical protein